jgi:hypothetical protein
MKYRSFCYGMVLLAAILPGSTGAPMSPFIVGEWVGKFHWQGQFKVRPDGTAMRATGSAHGRNIQDEADYHLTGVAKGDGWQSGHVTFEWSYRDDGIAQTDPQRECDFNSTRTTLTLTCKSTRGATPRVYKYERMYNSGY